MAGRNDDDSGTFASPPCAMHEVDPAYMNFGVAAESDPGADVKLWRKAEREQLIKKRLELARDTRRRYGERIIASLEAAIGSVSGLTVGVYWPFRGEPNLHPFMEKIESDGGRCALPVVIARGRPLIFRIWNMGDPLDRGVWNIPIPKESTEVALPDVVIALVIPQVPRVARLARSIVLTLKEQPFVEAANALGASLPRVLFRHIMPNTLSPLMVQATFICASAILIEAALSFLGAGTSTEVPSWGNMMAEGRVYLQVAFWIILYPGLLLMVSVLAINLVGDGLRDLLDPKMASRM